MSWRNQNRVNEYEKEYCSRTVLIIQLFLKLTFKLLSQTFSVSKSIMPVQIKFKIGKLQASAAKVSGGSRPTSEMPACAKIIQKKFRVVFLFWFQKYDQMKF